MANVIITRVSSFSSNCHGEVVVGLESDGLRSLLNSVQTAILSEISFDLTRLQSRMIQQLRTHGNTLSYDLFVSSVWYDYTPDFDSVKNTIYRLNRKFKEQGYRIPIHIVKRNKDYFISLDDCLSVL